MNRNYEKPHVYEQWAASRETHVAVATAIHAIADSRRTAQKIWESPTAAEEDHIKMAVEEYLEHGDFERSDDGRYEWGVSYIRLSE